MRKREDAVRGLRTAFFSDKRADAGGRYPEESRRDRSDGFSNRVRIYSFLLSLLVILVHAVNLSESGAALEGLVRRGGAELPFLLEDFFSNILGQAAVPGFFLLSGFLFFRGLRSFWEIAGKWRRRFFSLLLPYLSWNLMMYLLYLLMGRTVLSLPELLAGLMCYRYNPVFWYLHQLILLTALAPLLYWVLRAPWLRRATLFGSLLLVYLRRDLPYLNEDALLYYYLGALLSRERPEASAERGKEAGGLLLLFFFASVYLERGGIYFQDAGAIVLCTVLRRAAFPLALWLLLPERLPPARSFMRLGFFLYALHYPVVRAVALFLRLGGINGASAVQRGALLLLYFLLPPLCVLLSYGLSLRLRRLPFLWRLLSGGR